MTPIMGGFTADGIALIAALAWAARGIARLWPEGKALAIARAAAKTGRREPALPQPAPLPGPAPCWAPAVHATVTGQPPWGTTGHDEPPAHLVQAAKDLYSRRQT